jgi:formate hydrogenlyase subunit 4
MGQDALMVLFVLAFSTLALVIGGMCVRSPYSRIGSQREIMLMVAYEPILILLVVGMYKLAGSFRIDQVLEYSFSQGQPLMFYLPLVFIAFLIVMAIKLQKSPFDLATSHHMHQELVKGITIEYSGPYLAVLEIAHCYEVVILFTVLSLFWLTNIWAIVAIDIAAFILMIVIDNAFARLTTLWMFRFMWTTALGLALTNIIWLYIR